jgi:hypothetical protein
MKRYYQKTKTGLGKSGDIVDERTIEHLKPLSSQQTKLQKLSKWLRDNYSVDSFTQLKERGQDLINIRNKGLNHANLNS